MITEIIKHKAGTEIVFKPEKKCTFTIQHSSFDGYGNRTERENTELHLNAGEILRIGIPKHFKKLCKNFTKFCNRFDTPEFFKIFHEYNGKKDVKAFALLGCAEGGIMCEEEV